MAQIGTSRSELGGRPLRGIAAVLAGVALAGCFEPSAGGPGLEPPRGGDVTGVTGGTGGSFGNAGGVPVEDMGPTAGPPAPSTDTGGGAGGFAGGAATGSDAGTSGDAGTADAGSTVGTKVDPATLSCAELDATFAAELAAVQACEPSDSCEAVFIGSGCSDGLAPLCGFAVRAGADSEYLAALDAAYRAANCVGTGQIACASCAFPSSTPCVDGACTVAF